jgi:hypothetical protein
MLTYMYVCMHMHMYMYNMCIDMCLGTCTQTSTRTPSALRLPFRSDILLANRPIGDDFFAAGACGEASFRDLRDGGASLTLYSESSFSSSVSKCDLLPAAPPDWDLEPALYRPERPVRDSDFRPWRAGLEPSSRPSSRVLFLPNLVAGSCQSPVFLRKTDSLRTAVGWPSSFGAGVAGSLIGGTSSVVGGLARRNWLSRRTIGILVRRVEVAGFFCEDVDGSLDAATDAGGGVLPRLVSATG